MQKPDADGYVNVVWPSRNVPHGGIFHTHTAEPSADQQQFLKVLQEESKFNLKLRQSNAFGLRDDKEAAEARAAPRPVAPATSARIVRPHTSRRRSLSAIRCSGALDVDTYRPPKRGEDRERMKERLANTMAFGDSPQQTPPPPIASALQRQRKPAAKIPTNKEKWNELVTQIRERAEWLAEMEWLGEAAPHREIMQDQIAERMRALDALGVDSARSSVCSTARSAAHSTVRSAAQSTARSAGVEPRAKVSVRSSASSKGDVTKKSVRASPGRPKRPEENVSAYSQLSPLGYSPRRRV